MIAYSKTHSKKLLCIAAILTAGQVSAVPASAQSTVIYERVSSQIERAEEDYSELQVNCEINYCPPDYTDIEIYRAEPDGQNDRPCVSNCLPGKLENPNGYSTGQPIYEPSGD